MMLVLDRMQSYGSTFDDVKTAWQQQAMTCWTVRAMLRAMQGGAMEEIKM